MNNINNIVLNIFVIYRIVKIIINILLKNFTNLRKREIKFEFWCSFK